ncbi:MAG: hypothetical protein GC191_07625 [Azospirillum sp.]|nr:hypothetical protein [Azospirillum sp.]
MLGQEGRDAGHQMEAREGDRRTDPQLSGQVGGEEVGAKALRPKFGGTLIAAGGFTGASAEAILAAGHADLVAFGRNFIANPDLVDRLRRHLPLDRYDRDESARPAPASDGPAGGAEIPLWGSARGTARAFFARPEHYLPESRHDRLTHD